MLYILPILVLQNRQQYNIYTKDN